MKLIPSNRPSSSLDPSRDRPSHPERASRNIGRAGRLAGLAALWLATGCTRLVPPAYNLSATAPPRLLLQSGRPTWIGVRHAGLRGVFVMSEGFAGPGSLQCVYRGKARVTAQEAANGALWPYVFTDAVHLPGSANRPALYCNSHLDGSRLLAVIATPKLASAARKNDKKDTSAAGKNDEEDTSTAGRSDEKDTSAANNNDARSQDDAPRDGILCARRCNRPRRPAQHLKIEIVAPEPMPALPASKERSAAGKAAAGTAAGVAEKTTTDATTKAATDAVDDAVQPPKENRS